MTHEDRIVAVLRHQPDLDDDQLSKVTGISPRQAVNQACRRLEARGILARRPGARGKIVNRLCDGVRRTSVPGKTPGAIPAASAVYRQPESRPAPTHDLVLVMPQGWASTLFLIPCSGTKTAGCAPVRPNSLADHLPKHLRDRLMSVRARLATIAQLDETTLAPAWQRYTGSLYKAAGGVLSQAVDASMHIIIISGGYGLLLADEPIGTYNARFNLSDWPRGLLEECLLHYASSNRLQSVRAFMAGSTDYGKLLRRVSWRQSSIHDAVLITPETATGAMVKAPRALGEALSALLTNSLTPGWRSTDGLRMLSEQMGGQ